MLRLSDLIFICSKEELAAIPEGKVLINTINAHSYNVAQRDEVFARSLDPNISLTPNPSPNGKGNLKGEGNYNGEGECVKYLLPDGASIVKACQWLKGRSQPKERIAGWDLFVFEMGRVNDNLNDNRGGIVRVRVSVNVRVKKKVMFLGSSEKVLGLIRERAAKDYPNLEVVTYSPPFKEEFSEEENRAMIAAVNEAKPDLLWIGMTAPKQEKWTWEHWKELDIDCHVGTIGAVFDFYAGTAQRAPLWWQEHSLEWLYRLVKEPRRMWRRYVIGNPLFVWNVMRER